jgi:hypothetical protein
MKNEITLEYATRPSLVAKRVGARLKPEGSQVLLTREHSVWIFEPEEGLIFLRVSADNLSEGMKEIQATLHDLKLPANHEGTSLLTTREGSPLLESAGFTRDPLLKRWAWQHVVPETLSLTQTDDK